MRCHLEPVGDNFSLQMLTQDWLECKCQSTVTLQVYNPPGKLRSQQSHSVPGQDEDQGLVLYLDR